MKKGEEERKNKEGRGQNWGKRGRTRGRKIQRRKNNNRFVSWFCKRRRDFFPPKVWQTVVTMKLGHQKKWSPDFVSEISILSTRPLRFLIFHGSASFFFTSLVFKHARSNIGLSKNWIIGWRWESCVVGALQKMWVRLEVVKFSNASPSMADILQTLLLTALEVHVWRREEPYGIYWGQLSVFFHTLTNTESSLWPQLAFNSNLYLGLQGWRLKIVCLKVGNSADVFKTEMQHHRHKDTLTPGPVGTNYQI